MTCRVGCLARTGGDCTNRRGSGIANFCTLLSAFPRQEKYPDFMTDKSVVGLKHVLQQQQGFSDQMLGCCYSVLMRSIFGTSVSGGHDPYIVKEEARQWETLLLFRPDMYPSKPVPFPSTPTRMACQVQC